MNEIFKTDGYIKIFFTDCIYIPASTYTNKPTNIYTYTHKHKYIYICAHSYSEIYIYIYIYI